jgi:uncharacterized membrane protein YtjA (UPF0391 family)
MLGWAITFLVLAIIAAVLGFGGVVTGTLMFAAKAMFVVFILLMLLSFVFGRTSAPGPPVDPTSPYSPY